MEFVAVVLIQELILNPIFLVKMLLLIILIRILECTSLLLEAVVSNLEKRMVDSASDIFVISRNLQPSFWYINLYLILVVSFYVLANLKQNSECRIKVGDEKVKLMHSMFLWSGLKFSAFVFLPGARGIATCHVGRSQTHQFSDNCVGLHPDSVCMSSAKIGTNRSSISMTVRNRSVYKLNAQYNGRTWYHEDFFSTVQKTNTRNAETVS